jgi:hypothetical protein
VKPALLGSPTTDLSLSLTVPAVIGGPQINFPIQVSVTNHSVWSARGARFTVELSPGLVFADGTPGAGTNGLQLDWEPLNGATNVTLAARALTSGSGTIRASVVSSLPDVQPLNGAQASTITVPPPPVFLFDDVSVGEGSSSRPGQLVGTLSRPAPADLSVGFTITPLTADASDFSALTGAFQFQTGQSTAKTYAIHGDSDPELNETAMITFSSDRVTFAAASAVITIVNDDWPLVVVTNAAVNEGNFGFTNAVFRVTLSSKAPFPVDVRFGTHPGTAAAEADFLSREGWLRFAANEDVKLVAVPVRGDTDYEPNETASFALLNAVNAGFGVASAPLTIRNDDLPPPPQLDVVRLESGDLRIGFPTIPSATYQLESRTNLTTAAWTTLPSSIIGDGRPSTFVLGFPSGGEAYFRILAR